MVSEGHIVSKDGVLNKSEFLDCRTGIDRRNADMLEKYTHE